MPFYRRRDKGYLFSLNRPFPSDPEPKQPIYENILSKALRFDKYLKADPARSFRHVSENFDVSRARVSQLMSLVDRLPRDFIKKVGESDDQDTLRVFTGRTLLKISKLNTLEKRRDRIRDLWPG